MRLLRKGELSINMIIVIVIALIILVIIIFLVAKGGKSADQGTACGLKGGICEDNLCGTRTLDADCAVGTAGVKRYCCSPLG
jgi:ABC-type Na+ efflux pump permease subunit